MHVPPSGCNTIPSGIWSASPSRSNVKTKLLRSSLKNRFRAASRAKSASIWMTISWCALESRYESDLWRLLQVQSRAKVSVGSFNPSLGAYLGRWLVLSMFGGAILTVCSEKCQTYLPIVFSQPNLSFVFMYVQYSFIIHGSIIYWGRTGTWENQLIQSYSSLLMKCLKCWSNTSHHTRDVC